MGDYLNSLRAKVEQEQHQTTIMKFIIAILLTAILAFLGGIYLPWWSIVPAAFIAGVLVYQSAFRSFLCGFLGILLLWSGLAWWIDSANESILSSRIAQLLPGPDTSFFVILLTGIVGGLVGGLGALMGHFLRGRK